MLVIVNRVLGRCVEDSIVIRQQLSVFFVLILNEPITTRTGGSGNLDVRCCNNAGLYKGKAVEIMEDVLVYLKNNPQRAISFYQERLNGR